MLAMKSYLVMTSLLIHVYSGLAKDATSSTWIKDTSYDNKTTSSGCGLTTRSRIDCADACAANITCRSFFFARGQHENCRILSTILPPQAPEILYMEGSSYYILAKYTGMLFRGSVGIGVDFDTAEAWNAAGPGTTTDTSCRNVKLDGCTRHYRHPVIDDWSTLNLQQLRYSIYKNDIEVVWVLFNATGSDKTNWFHQSRVLASSYTDLTPDATYNYFTIDPGLTFIDRHFYINNDWNGCGNDTTWFVTLDDTGVCSMDQYPHWPYILYSKLETKANTGTMSDFDFGDCSIITVVS